MKVKPPPCPSAELPAARRTPHREAGTDLSTATFLPCIIGFQEARARLLAQFEPAASCLAPTPQARQTADRRARCTRWTHPLERSLYWLLSAAALGGVLLGVLSL